MTKGYDISDLSDDFLQDLAKLHGMSSRISSYSLYLHDIKDDRYPLINWLALSLQAIKKELTYQTDGTWIKEALKRERK